MPETHRHRILFLDAYDSFSNNIVSLLTDVLSVHVDILPIDASRLLRQQQQQQQQQPPPCGSAEDIENETKQDREDLRRLVARYDAVVCGPGPGHPTRDQDVGLMRHIWDLGDGDDSVVPVLGICLGFQSLVVHCGGVVRKLSTGLHGMIRDIDHVDNDLSLDSGNIFAGVPAFKATLYHSLFADIGQHQHQHQHRDNSEEEWSRSRWQSPTHLPDVVPLAWLTEDRGASFTERILMGVKHRRKPFWGLQYHPESVCTETTGHQVIRNWFAEALRWNRTRDRRTATALQSPSPLEVVMYGLPRSSRSRSANPFAPATKDCSLWNSEVDCKYYSRTLNLPNHVEVPDIVESLQRGRRDFIVLDSASAKTSRTGLDVRGRYSIIALDVDEALKLEYRTGSQRLTLRRRGHCRNGIVDNNDDTGDKTSTSLVESVEFSAEEHTTIWKVLASFWARRQLTQSYKDPAAIGREEEESTLPFLGGFMGFTTYELGLEGIGVDSRDHDKHARPDLSFAWVTRSAVVDHMEGTVCLQTLSPDKGHAGEWLDRAAEELVSSPVWTDGLGADFSKHDGHHNVGVAYNNNNNKELSTDAHGKNLTTATAQPTPPLTPETAKPGPGMQIQVPDADDYEAKVRECQDHIASGDSYELCLTDQTLITRPRKTSRMSSLGFSASSQQPSTQHHQQKQGKESLSSSWSLYRALRARNPAPFGSYIRLGGATLVSSSPERFLEFTTSTSTTSPSCPSFTSSPTTGQSLTCSMRPMKGTVKKSSTVSTLEQAEQILHVPKEEAENLMIVDLVRHDLHGVCGAGAEAVQVPQLLKVEEYASVFQMISVVEGRVPVTPSTHPAAPRGSDDKEQQQKQHQQVQVTGLDVLAATLPPGSMTGAPKKRSCEILQEVEQHRERSLYSGVVGYMDVRGNGDWSVTIRSLFRWDDEQKQHVAVTPSSAVAAAGTEGAANSNDNNDDGEGSDADDEKQQCLEVWHIGAGGAVTALSTPHGERDEMFTKLKGPLGVFEDQV